MCLSKYASRPTYIQTDIQTDRHADRTTTRSEVVVVVIIAVIQFITRTVSRKSRLKSVGTGHSPGGQGQIVSVRGQLTKEVRFKQTFKGS